MPLRIGTPVMVVRTGTELDGATGAIVRPQGYCLGTAIGGWFMAIGYGYGVQLTRPVVGASDWAIAREYLVPLTPPDDAIKNQRVHVAPVDERLVA